MPFLLANWRVLLLLGVLALAGAVVGVSRYQVANCRAELAEYRRAYDLLAQSVARQNEAVHDMERKAAEAARKAAQARSEAAGAVDVAIRSAEALSRHMSEPAGTSCPAGEGLEIVRADLRGILK